VMPSYPNVPRQPFAGRSGNTMLSGMGGSKLKHVDSVRSLRHCAARRRGILRTAYKSVRRTATRSPHSSPAHCVRQCGLWVLLRLLRSHLRAV